MPGLTPSPSRPAFHQSPRVDPSHPPALNPSLLTSLGLCSQRSLSLQCRFLAPAFLETQPIFRHKGVNRTLSPGSGDVQNVYQSVWHGRLSRGRANMSLGAAGQPCWSAALSITLSDIYVYRSVNTITHVTLKVLWCLGPVHTLNPSRVQSARVPKMLIEFEWMNHLSFKKFFVCF